ncbi:uncharacterized protein LOC111629338 [Centruroides sculpturatus]|uniref:uncharacterized protein LOC111629338 n=1 Tax=Centruroides sculpturatus TaxID=218467 RepID=UPI000C6DCCC7|nr:uncharacterized protein LOC111629338 [Centruroides sculpturatus]
MSVSDVEPIHFYIKRHKKKLTWQSVVNPFTKQVWLALIFTITIFGLIFRKFVKDNKGEPWTLRRTYWYLMSTLMSQGVDSNNVNRLSSRIAFGIWLLMTAVLIWGYAGILTSFMALQTDEPVPNTFDELAEGIERREYTCVLIPHVYLDRYLKVSLLVLLCLKAERGRLIHRLYGREHKVDVEGVVKVRRRKLPNYCKIRILMYRKVFVYYYVCMLLLMARWRIL